MSRISYTLSCPSQKRSGSKPQWSTAAATAASLLPSLSGKSSVVLESQGNRTVGPARVSRLHKRSLSFTLQFKKNFKLVRLLNTGRLGNSSQFRAHCPPTRRRRRRGAEEWWWLLHITCAMRDLGAGTNSFTVRIRPSSPARARERGCRTSPDRWRSGQGRWKRRKRTNPWGSLAHLFTPRGAAWSQV